MFTEFAVIPGELDLTTAYARQASRMFYEAAERLAVMCGVTEDTVEEFVWEQQHDQCWTLKRSGTVVGAVHASQDFRVGEETGCYRWTVEIELLNEPTEDRSDD